MDVFKSYKGNILIVDDQIDNLKVLAAVLTEQGYSVRQAISGPIALQTVRKMPPDLILLDIRMPEMDGYELCERLKADVQTRDIPIIFLSVLEDVSDKVKGLKIGGVDYITKPFQSEEVVARVETHLNLQRLQKELEKKNADLQQEITERKRVEKKLRFLSLIAEQVSDSVITTDLNHEITWTNQSFQRLYKYSSQEILGRTPDFLNVEPTSEQIQNGIYQTVSSDKVWKGEVLNRRKDGSIFPCELVIFPLVDEQGNIFAYAGHQRDITERKRAEETLRESEERYRSFITHSSEGIYRVDVVPPVPIDLPYTEIVKYINEHAIVAEVNNALAGMYGLTTEEMIGKLATDFAPDYGVRAELVLQNTDYQVTHEETLDVDKEGNPLYLEESYRGEISDGHLVRIWGVQRNITERKRAEEKIRKLNAELEERVKQRTAELEAANKELKDFAYVVSHDLKAPLRGISQLAQWLVTDYTDAFDEQGKNMIDLLVGRVRRMDNLIEGILQYSRVGRIVGENEKLELNSLVQDVISGLAPPDHIKIWIENNLPIITGERIRIIQVFQNLIGNAIEYMDKPDGEIIIGCRDDGSCWKFSIVDNGPGIEEKYYEKIFQIFQTLVPRDEHESTGIGLALVKKIIELHGGKIWVESTVGESSVFWFTLPKKGKNS